MAQDNGNRGQQRFREFQSGFRGSSGLGVFSDTDPETGKKKKKKKSDKKVRRFFQDLFSREK